MPYNFAADSFHTKKLWNFVADFLQAKCDVGGKTAVLPFWVPFGVLGATYDDHLWLIGKRVVDFLLIQLLIELFSLGVKAEALRVIICSKSGRFRSNGGRLTQNFR